MVWYSLALHVMISGTVTIVSCERVAIHLLSLQRHGTADCQGLPFGLFSVLGMICFSDFFQVSGVLIPEIS